MSAEKEKKKKFRSIKRKLMVNSLLIPNLIVADPEISLDVLPIVAAPAILLTGAGIGALIAAWVMHRLAKNWGMLKAQGSEVSAD